LPNDASIERDEDVELEVLASDDAGNVTWRVKPRRRFVMRGSELVEVDAMPRRETRGTGGKDHGIQ
jgi:hypothetical protein